MGKNKVQREFQKEFSWRVLILGLAASNAVDVRCIN